MQLEEEGFGQKFASKILNFKTRILSDLTGALMLYYRRGNRENGEARKIEK